MTVLYAAWAASLLVAAWSLIVGGIRLVAYRSGSADHTPGMRNVMRFALVVGAAAMLCFVVLTVAILAQR
jgi:hypothetical protein